MSSGHGPERGRGGVGPWQEIVETALGMAVDDAADDVGQVVVGLHADELAGFDQGSDDGPMFGAAVGSGEECIFPIEGQRADGAFDGIGVDLDATVIKEETKPGPAREGIADCLCELCFLADQRELFAQPRLERLDQRSGALLTDSAAFLGRATADLGFDPIECGDPCERLARDRGGAGLGQLVEAAAVIGPAILPKSGH
jgi:hypothetical protein